MQYIFYEFSCQCEENFVDCASLFLFKNDQLLFLYTENTSVDTLQLLYVLLLASVKLFLY